MRDGDDKVLAEPVAGTRPWGVGHMVEKGAMVAMKQFSAGVFEVPAAAAPSCCKGGKLKGKSCCA
ncbi:MAG: hypothetical protein WCR06_06485 [bacterium]